MAGSHCGTLLIRIKIGHRIKLGALQDTRMLRASQFFSLLCLAAWMTLNNIQAGAQALNPVGWPEWDSKNQVLFFSSYSPGSVVRAYVEDHQRGADIDIFRDFPGPQRAYVDHLTAGPDGSTLIAATMSFGNHNIREMVLTYDSSGQSLKTWDPARQYVEAMAYSKDDDAVFVLGGRALPNGPYVPNYPILIEYSRDGRVSRVRVLIRGSSRV